MAAPTLSDFHALLDTVQTQNLQSVATANATIEAWQTANPIPGTRIEFAEVTVSSAEVLALNASPKTLVAAPGAGYLLEFLGAVIILDYNSVAYDGVASGEDLVIKYTNGSGAAVSTTLETTGFIDQTSDQIRTIKPLATDITPAANAALVLHMLTGEIATGNSPLRLKVKYMVWATGL